MPRVVYKAVLSIVSPITRNSSRLFSYLRKRLVQNIAALYVVQFSNYLLPLLTVPYLSRVLGPDGWGAYVFFQSIGLFVWAVVEYSFTVTATREVAMNKDAIQARADWIAKVLGAKSLLSLAVILAAFVAFSLFPMVQNHSALFWWAIVWAITFGWNLQWYLQGLERMKLAATLDLIAKTVATVGIFLFVHNPEESWRAFAMQATANILTLLVALFVAYREVPFHFPSFDSAVSALHIGWRIFTARLAVTFSATGNNFILGLFAPPALIGFFGGADKIVGATSSLLCNPVTQAVFPRLSHSLQHEPERAEYLIRKSYRWMFMLGALSALVLFFGAPLIVRILLGQGYEATVPVLKVMAVIPLLLALTNVFGMQWMLAKKLDKQFNRIVIGSALLNVTFAWLLIPTYGIVGMAWAVCTAKIVELVATNVVLVRVKMHPILNAKN